MADQTRNRGSSEAKPPLWTREFTTNELDRFMQKARELRRAARFAGLPVRVGLLELYLEQAGLAWALACRMDIERTRTGAEIRGGNEAIIRRLRCLARGPVQGEVLPPVMAEIALAVDDSRLLAAAGDGRRGGSHEGSLLYVELWCRMIEHALEGIFELARQHTESFAPTEIGRMAYGDAANPSANRRYAANLRRSVRLYREGRIANVSWLKNASLFARLDSLVPGDRVAHPDRHTARLLLRTGDELTRWTKNTRRLIELFDKTRPGEVFAMDPRLQNSA
jgi:hypothetical protein